MCTTRLVNNHAAPGVSQRKKPPGLCLQAWQKDAGPNQRVRRLLGQGNKSEGGRAGREESNSQEKANDE